MSLQFQNTLSGTKDVFAPIEDNHVRMYNCGPTVYDYAHIGNFRAYIFEDLLRRYLIYKGYKVTQVMNITDIDDKTIRESNAKGLELTEYTRPYTQAFFEDLEALGIEKAEHYPCATDYIPEMIEIIQTLLDKGIAYESEGSVYYHINKFPDYGKLSKKKIEENVAGSRVDHDEYERDDVRDFVLWKKHKDGEPSWDAPFGKGRPGWHIECSAMSKAILGDTFDIHTGGEDNIFPHHENEIAQSEGASGKPFVHYWMHCKFLLVNNEKMSKSKGNFYTLRDLMKLGYSPVSVRYILLTHNYGHPLNFTLEGLKQADAAIKRIRTCVQAVNESDGSGSNDFMNEIRDHIGDPIEDDKPGDFEKALDDDLNIARAMCAVFDFVWSVNTACSPSPHQSKDWLSAEGKKNVLEAFARIDKVLNFILVDEAEVPAEILALAEERQTARKEKNYGRSDEIRDELAAQGWVIEDTPKGPRVKKA